MLHVFLDSIALDRFRARLTAKSMRAKLTWPIAAGLLLGLAAGAAAAPDESLPLVHVPAAPSAPGRPLVLLLSGDGDWSAFVHDLAAALAAGGSPVLGLEARSYFSTARTPDETARALEQAVRAELAERHAESLVVIGYSRGADVAPFVLNRWPVDLRARVRAVALVGLGERASFEFHLEDLVREVERPTDLAIRPEVEKLGAVPLLCMRGESERGSFCERPVPGMRTLVHPGGHRAPDDPGTIALLLRELELAE
jgi:type IV secretory pathway VirJ component